jgi:hypothetical protein
MVRTGIYSNVVVDFVFAKIERSFISNRTGGARGPSPLHNLAMTFIPNQTIFFMGAPL